MTNYICNYDKYSWTPIFATVSWSKKRFVSIIDTREQNLGFNCSDLLLWLKLHTEIHFADH